MVLTESHFPKIVDALGTWYASCYALVLRDSRNVSQDKLVHIMCKHPLRQLQCSVSTQEAQRGRAELLVVRQATHCFEGGPLNGPLQPNEGSCQLNDSVHCLHAGQHCYNLQPPLGFMQGLSSAYGYIHNMEGQCTRIAIWQEGRCCRASPWHQPVQSHATARMRRQILRQSRSLQRHSVGVATPLPPGLPTRRLSDKSASLPGAGTRPAVSPLISYAMAIVAHQMVLSASQVVGEVSVVAFLLFTSISRPPIASHASLGATSREEQACGEGTDCHGLSHAIGDLPQLTGSSFSLRTSPERFGWLTGAAHWSQG